MDSQSFKATLTDLPMETLDIIVSWLGQKELSRLARTCRRLNEAFTPRLWHDMRISTDLAFGAAYHAVNSRAALAQAVKQLNLLTLTYDGRNDGGIYCDLALAAALPNLQRLVVHTGQLEYDGDRSLAAAQALRKLRNLESCDLFHAHSNFDFWTSDVWPAIISLVYHPTMRTVCLRDFLDGLGCTSLCKYPDHYPDYKRIKPLQKLSLYNCDMSPRDVADLLHRLAPVELEYLHWHQFDKCAGRNHEDPIEYIEAIRQAGIGSLERLAFYRDFDKQIPIQLESFQYLKHLATNMDVLCGREFLEYASDAPLEIFLPVQLESLDVLCFDDSLKEEILPFFTALIGCQKRNMHSLDVRFRTAPSMDLTRLELQQLHILGRPHGILVTTGHLPEDWVSERAGYKCFNKKN